MDFYQRVGIYLGFLLLCLFVLFYPYLALEKTEINSFQAVRVLTYPSFIAEWGSGPELARQFFEKTGLKIQWINAGNAGLILERLRFRGRRDRPDVILGLDRFHLTEARSQGRWKDLSEIYENLRPSILPEGARVHDFFAYNWGMLTFIYREGEVTPPKKLEDLLAPEYALRVILQDPRMSSPGLQFYLWVLNVYGEEKGLDFLRQLQDSIRVMAPSWSSGYSLFQVTKGSLVFSYFTSVLYHSQVEGRTDYRAVQLSQPHPVHVEYAGVPETCGNCSGAIAFLDFLASPSAQKVLAQKNFMYPAHGAALEGEIPKANQVMPIGQNWPMEKSKKELIEKWKKVFY